ncbi:MAG: response regulator transcription factor [Anaerolineales bacterium]|nr:response regulator transcription factor [Anaerolineales bacterium]
MSSTHILVADDHALFRDGLRALILAQDDLEWVGEAADGSEVIEKAAALQPDVILMDINMPTYSGIEATTRILQELPETKIIMVTMLEDDASVFAALRVGARGYVLKGSNADEMLAVIRAVAQGQVLFGAAMAQRMLNFFQSAQNEAEALRPFPDLTERERELLDLIAAGLSNNDIAQKLVISPKTVSNHITNIFDKLKVADRAQAIIKARAAGLGKDVH